MEYLEAVPWTAENKHEIRASIMSLQLPASPDLAARLSPAVYDPNFNPLIIMENYLSGLLSLVSRGASEKVREITKKAVRDNKQFNISRAFAALNKSLLLKELHKNLEFVKSQLDNLCSGRRWHQIIDASSALSWLLDEMFALQIAEEAVKVFSEKKDLSYLMLKEAVNNPFSQSLFSILVRLLEALRIGEVVCPRSVRLSLLTTWLPVILAPDYEYILKDTKVGNNLEQGLRALVVTLPIPEQEQVFKLWTNSFQKGEKTWLDLSAAFDMWCYKLRVAQSEKEHRVSSEGGDTASVASSVVKEDSSSA